jgi:hypothetical protein
VELQIALLIRFDIVEGRLSVPFPTKYKIVVKTKMAKAIGVTIPESYLQHVAVDTKRRFFNVRFLAGDGRCDFKSRLVRLGLNISACYALLYWENALTWCAREPCVELSWRFISRTAVPTAARPVSQTNHHMIVS